MRNILFIFILAVIVFGCTKKNVPANEIPKDIPEWLKTKIEEIKSNQNSNLFLVSEVRIDGVTYYNISSPISSCWPCNLYDVSGNRVYNLLNGTNEIKEVRKIWPTGTR